MNKGVVIVALVVAVLVAGGLFVLWDSEQEAPLRSSETSSAGHAPTFSLKNYDGDIVSLSDFEGTPLVINAWAAWCPFCVKELPDFVTVQQEFADEVVFVAINRAESLETAKGFTDELGVSRDLVFLLDPADSFYRDIGAFAMPETIFVKGDGTIHFHKRGFMTVDEVRQRTQELIDA